MKAACPKCKGATIHNNICGYMICTKCGDRNAITIQKAILLSKK